jgi:hypothetical protein
MHRTQDVRDGMLVPEDKVVFPGRLRCRIKAAGRLEKNEPLFPDRKPYMSPFYN